ncbi:hypothetical protein GZ77_13050 [Endozoicomonas montiporae]|uniref:Solute-binding protein family 3/N-terminal domain-containing protein n=2 Tax=Endozoicomonas montiporae TaxID=1027273 RepID=A0A081N4G8_9GAMM|nr:transporter substrate-binding domain-containing protein [Endozoicomonas montiporae]AMO57804.1 amino acid ABC transporter periplasmic protein [Endozoicomonas montiporae CL-33]KEQ13341.1 hypothetical protein GZ77_13050 [Endozoicomonas montiporae]
MHRLFILIIAVFLSLSTFYRPYAEESVPRQRETLTVGVFPQDYPPLHWHDARKGIIEKLLDKVSSVSHFDFVFSKAPFHRLIMKVEKGKIDLEPWTSEVWRTRVKDNAYFTSPYTEHCEVLIFQKDRSFPVKRPFDLAGKRLGVVKGYAFQSFSKLFAKNVIYRVNSSNEERVLNLLSRGRTDAALIDELIADYLLKTTYSQAFVKSSTFDCVPVSFMFHKSKLRQGVEINKILQTLKKEGFIEQLLKGY